MDADKVIHVISTTTAERAEQARICFQIGYHAEIYSCTSELLMQRPRAGLILCEDSGVGGSVVNLIQNMAENGLWLPVIATGAVQDSDRVVDAIKGGAIDYLPLPLDVAVLAMRLSLIGEEARSQGRVQRKAVEAKKKLSRLTPREKEVLELLVEGATNKMIARELGISPRTVEIHRANVMTKLDAHHAADAVRIRLEAALGHGPGALPLSMRRQAA